MDDIATKMLLGIGAVKSVDGASWTTRIPGRALNNAPAYSPELGLFVAVGDSGTILASP